MMITALLFSSSPADNAIDAQPLGLVGKSLLISAHHLDRKLALR